jgi:hypothetical protein
MNAPTKRDRRELVAIVVSGTVLAVSAIYWIVQVLGVIEMLRLAYG